MGEWVIDLWESKVKKEVKEARAGLLAFFPRCSSAGEMKVSRNEVWK